MAELLKQLQLLLFTDPMGSSVLLSGENMQAHGLQFRSWLQQMYQFINPGAYVGKHL